MIYQMYDIYLLSLSLPQRYSTQAVRDVIVSYEALVYLFERIQRSLQRLNHYTAVSVMPEMTALLSSIVAQILSFLALPTSAMKERRISRSIQSLYTLG